MMRFKNARYLFLLALLIFGVNNHAQRILSLQQALEQAYQFSPRMQNVKLSLVQSEQNLKAQRAALKSNFSLNINPVSFSQGDDFNRNISKWESYETVQSNASLNISQPILLTDGVITLNNTFNYRDSQNDGWVWDKDLGTYTPYPSNYKGYNNSLSLRLEQPLFTYNKTKLQLKELELAYENASLNYALQELSVENMVTQAFYKVYQSQMELNVSTEDYQNRKQSHEIIKNKVEGGLVAKEELYQSELDLLSSKSSMQNDQVTFENDKDNFKQMLGIALDEEIMVLADISVPPVDIDITKAIKSGVDNRMEIRQREIDIEQGQFDLIRTNALNEFKGNLTVDVGLIGQNENVADVFNKQNNSQDITVGFSIPLWDWGEKKARLKASKAALEMNQNDLRDEEIDIKLNIRQVYRSLQNLLIQIEISRKNVENAQLTYEINLEKYKNGDLTSMDLNLVQNQLTQNKNSLTNAIINYKLELLNMKIQSMYDFENSKEVAPNFSPKNKK